MPHSLRCVFLPAHGLLSLDPLSSSLSFKADSELLELEPLEPYKWLNAPGLDAKCGLDMRQALVRQLGRVFARASLRIKVKLWRIVAGRHGGRLEHPLCRSMRRLRRFLQQINTRGIFGGEVIG